MTQYSYGELETLWLDTAKGTRYATQAWASLMAAIAMAESSGKSDAYNPSGATGLWQILGAVTPSDQSQLTNPTVNAREALQKLQSQGLGAWVTYTSGAYKQFLSGTAPSSLPTGTGAPTSTGTGADAQLTGFNWTWGLPIPGLSQLGQLFSGTTGTFSSIGDVAKGIAGIVQAINKLTQLFMLLFRPDFWLRVGAFLFGIVTLGAAVYFLREAF